MNLSTWLVLFIVFAWVASLTGAAWFSETKVGLRLARFFGLDDEYEDFE